MNREKIVKTYQRLVNEGREGFTLDLDGDEYRPKSGFAVACCNFNTISDLLDYIESNISQADWFVGWWTDEKTNKNYIEAVTVVESPFNAFVKAMYYRQIAFYNFATDSVVDVSRFYDESKQSS